MLGTNAARFVVLQLQGVQQMRQGTSGIPPCYHGGNLLGPIPTTVTSGRCLHLLDHLCAERQPGCSVRGRNGKINHLCTVRWHETCNHFGLFFSGPFRICMHNQSYLRSQMNYFWGINERIGLQCLERSAMLGHTQSAYVLAWRQGRQRSMHNGLASRVGPVHI